MRERPSEEQVQKDSKRRKKTVRGGKLMEWQTDGIYQFAASYCLCTCSSHGRPLILPRRRDYPTSKVIFSPSPPSRAGAEAGQRSNNRV